MLVCPCSTSGTVPSSAIVAAVHPTASKHARGYVTSYIFHKKGVPSLRIKCSPVRSLIKERCAGRQEMHQLEEMRQVERRCAR